ncbi:adenylate cyclase type 3-like isoform X2 [Mytilus edulis]|uniref:adenylate cyclase type 3-like isoform X2 n=1 Tax=Mytilus edulis TaxID=6550 RepID=UPI0039F0895E
MTSVEPICSRTPLEPMSWNGFRNQQTEIHYHVFKWFVYRRLSKCLIFVGIVFNIVQIIILIIWDSSSMTTITVLCICLLVFVAFYLTSMIRQIQDNFCKYIIIGVIILETTEFYIFDNNYCDYWPTTLVFLMFGCLPHRLRYRFIFAVTIILPKIVFTRDTSQNEELNGSMLQKIILFFLLTIPIFLLGFSMNLHLDTDLRKSFSTQNMAKKETENSVNILIEQEKTLLNRMPFPLASILLQDIKSDGKQDEIEKKMYTCCLKNVSISVIQMVMLDDLLATNEMSPFTALQEILDSIEILSKSCKQRMIGSHLNTFVFISDVLDFGYMPVEMSVNMSLSLLNKVRQVSMKQRVNINVRAGIHIGDIWIALLGQVHSSADAFGEDLNIAKEILETGDYGTVQCSQHIKKCIGYHFQLEEKQFQSTDTFLSSRCIKCFEVTGTLNDINKLNVNEIQQPDWTRFCRMIPQSDKAHRKRERRWGDINIGSLSTVPIVLFFQLLLVIVTRQLLLSEAIVFAITIILFLLIPICVIWKTKRQTAFPMFKVMTMPVSSRTFCLLYSVFSAGLLLLCNVLYTVDNLNVNSVQNISDNTEEYLLHLQSNNTILTLLTISHMMFNCIVNYLCLIGDVIVIWLITITSYQYHGYKNGQYTEIKSLINITGIATCLLFFQKMLDIILQQIQSDIISIQKQNSIVVHIESKMKLVIRKLQPPDIIRKQLVGGKGSSYETYSNIGILIVSYTLQNSDWSMNNIHSLDTMIRSFDSLVQRKRFEGLTKINGNTSAYIVVSGMPSETKMITTHESLMLFAMSVQEEIRKCQTDYTDNPAFKMGLHTGPVMIGICSDYVGIWGVSVDICKAISCSKQNVHLKVSGDFAKCIDENKYQFYKGESVMVTDKTYSDIYFQKCG